MIYRSLQKYKTKKIIQQIHRETDMLYAYTLQDLREETEILKDQILDQLSSYNNKIDEIKSRIEREHKYDILKSEELFIEIEKIQKKKRKKEEKILDKLLPRAFAILKETTRRFTENEELIVTTSQRDIELSMRNNSQAFYINYESGQTHFFNHWDVRDNHMTWKMIPYDEQLQAGILLHKGSIIEMANGEGKTLAAIFPAYLNALSGKKVHVVTSNHYLAKRDAEWMGPILAFHGFATADIETPPPHSPQRKKAYQADIIYGSSNEFGFDYLRDNMVRVKDEKVQNTFDFAIIDEVDSVLIDDALTPLIISGPIPGKEKELEMFKELDPIAAKFCREHILAVEEAFQLAKESFHNGNKDACHKLLLMVKWGLPGYTPFLSFIQEHSLIFALNWQEKILTLQNVEDHPREKLLVTLQDKDRNIKITENGKKWIAEQSGQPDFWKNIDLNDIFATIEAHSISDWEEKEEKEEAIAKFEEIEQRHHILSQLIKAYLVFQKGVQYEVLDGQVLIIDENTGRLMTGRRYSDGLHQAIEQKEKVKLGEITQTYATISLHGFFKKYQKISGMSGTVMFSKSEFKQVYSLNTFKISTHRPIIRKDKQDLVYKSKKEKTLAIIDTILDFYSKGQPVLLGVDTPDESSRYSRMLHMRGVPHQLLDATNFQKEAEIIARAGTPGQVTISAKLAGRGTDIKPTDEALRLGGLVVISAQRHDSRRHDDQLRGRTGRQGNPGVSQFFVSLEDYLMRLFQSARIARLMDSMGHQDGDVIQHSMVSQSIVRAQKKVEENNQTIRARLNEYDASLHVSREIIYERRNNAIHGHRLQLDVMNLFYDTCKKMVADNCYNYADFRLYFLEIFGYEMPFSETEFLQDNKIVEKLFEYVYHEQYLPKLKSIADEVIPEIRYVHRVEKGNYKRILLPLETKMEVNNPISADILRAVLSGGASIREDIESAVIIHFLDKKWKQFLRYYDELKDQVNIKSQLDNKDPLLLFKSMFLDNYQTLLAEINEATVSCLATIKLAFPPPVINKKEEESNFTKQQEWETDETTNSEIIETPPSSKNKDHEDDIGFVVRRGEKKIGRNDQCPCGSGKLYKHCHGRK